MITRPWHVQVRTIRPLSGFMRTGTVGYEIKRAPDYRFEGRFRQGEGHAFFQYTFAGRGIFCYDGIESDVAAGSGFLVRAADSRHAYYYPPAETTPWIFIWISFYGDAALQLVDDLTARHGFLFDLPPDSQLLAPFLAFRNSSGLRVNTEGDFLPIELEPYTSAQLASDLLLGLGDTCGGHQAEEPHALLAHKAQRLIREQLAQELNASQLAEGLGVSREHLARVFREQTGMSPYAYIARQKILRACRYLKESELSQKEIAARLGFSTLEAFSRSFRRIMKLSPGRYRLHGVTPVE